jgi:hypothetical protein
MDMDSVSQTGRHDGAPPAQVRVAFYGRVGRDDDPLLSLQRQLHAVQAVFAALSPVVRCYADVGPRCGVGGGSAVGLRLGDFRVEGGIDQLLARAASTVRDFEVLACSTIDRLSPRYLDGVRIEADLAEHGVQVVATADTPAIAVPAALDGAAALRARTRRWAWDLVADECARKSRTARDRLLAQGWHIGRMPYGYRADTVVVDGVRRTRLLVDPVHAPVVRAIFTLRVQDGLGVVGIARALNAHAAHGDADLPHTAGASRRWSAGAVRAILANPVYTGHHVRGRRDATGRTRPLQEWMWSADTVHEPIVSRDVFVAGQQVPGIVASAPRVSRRTSAVAP